MEIILAKTAGFCFGVERAVDIAYKELEKQKLYCYGSLINNKIVMSDLEKKGLKVIDNIRNNENETILLRAHGVSPEIYNYLNDEKIPFIDCTCPYVKKIHNIVRKDLDDKREIIIIGDENHPEIIGIFGYANNKALILNSIEEIKKTKFDFNKKYSLVVQTTFNTDLFQDVLKEFENLNLDIKIHNTICSATKERQDEAKEIAKSVDKMIVIGDRQSSNTKKLFDISKKYCENSFLIESISELELNIFSYDDKIGITAGASTASSIIKEAIYTMSEEELSFAELLDQSIITIRAGEIVIGKVIRVSNGEVSVNLGYKSDGIISREELSDDPNFKAEDEFKEDDDIEVFVVKVNDGEGNVALSRRRLEARKGLEKIEVAFNEKAVVTGKIVDVVKGGLMALINGTKIFVPSSQISNRFVDDLKVFLNEELNFNIIEFDPGKRRIVAGRKELARQEEEEARGKLFETLDVGQKLKGVVRRIVDFGAFVDLGGVDGLIHISELSWGRVKKVSDVLKEGENVEVTVIDFDKEKGKISLSLKDIGSDPWKDVVEKYPIGEIVEGKIVRMAPFGAFVELEDGVDGLVHISQISDKHVVKPEDVLSVGEIINVKVTEVNSESKRISLSKKEAEASFLEDEEVEEAIEEVTEEPTEEVVIEEVTEEPTEEVVIEEVTEEPTEEVVIEEVTEEPAEEIVIEEVTEEPVEEIVIEEVTEEPVEEVVIEEVTEEPVEEIVIEEPADEPADETEEEN